MAPIDASLWYEVEVIDHEGNQLDSSSCENLEIARRTVTHFRVFYPKAKWITTNRHKAGRITAMVSMTVHDGTTAAERAAAGPGRG